MSKIVDTDNHGGDYPNEKFVEVVLTLNGRAFSLSEKMLKSICQWSNDRDGDYATRYLKVVKDDYELQPGFEP